MKSREISIKWKIFGYLAAFVAILLVLLWLFQIVFLESFYKSIKSKKIKSYGDLIEKNIDNEDLQSLLDRISNQNDVCIRVMDSKGYDKYSIDAIPNCAIHKMHPSQIYGYYEEAKKNNGSVLEISSKEDIKGNGFNEKFFVGKMPPPDMIKEESMIYVKVGKKSDGSEIMIILNSVITPVKTTIETLRVQLIYITIILVVLSLILALFISKKVSRPIIKINDSAKELANGQYDTIFSGKGYREIEELNDTLNYAASELSKVEGLRRELIANISHDLRTPLTMIAGYSEVMRDIPGENTPENVQIIIDETQRLANLVNDILDISKIQSGSHELTIEKFNLTDSIRSVLERYKKLTEQEGYFIKFIEDCEVYVEADEIKLSQVIYNLINNAINYTGDDKLVKVLQKVNGDTVRIEVIDTGKGIPKEDIEYIWDRYYKVDKSHKSATIGTGLGLSIVKTVLDAHDGKYGVTSIENKGSTFWFEIKKVNL
ncbi:Signal transduction histidine kinase [Clostridium cadaveris]|uniref:histidine kinase n=1 Tax=Clostridium cadaveris TaxID=1529 RepID=A0A1I2KEV0_9CLOT|nr:HAMP domain-containing sensor histidine kinase [Clostridium cadaveris]MDM8312525.1 HAMP domain-containing sensor histidine kinase [Clostridium cadaveris]SFF65494.1 Signal transduction histidine kinase [Clostridium cadaveris]